MESPSNNAPAGATDEFWAFNPQQPPPAAGGGDDTSLDELLALYQTAQDAPAGAPFAPMGEPDSYPGFGDFNASFGDPATDQPFPGAPGADPVPLSPEPELPAGLRYADFARVGQEVWCLRETLLDPAGTEVRRALVALPLDGRAADDPGAVRVLSTSHQLMTGPKVSPDGRQVAWIGWNHPDMPWDTTDLMCAPVRPDGTWGPARRVAGGPGVSVGVKVAVGGPGV